MLAKLLIPEIEGYLKFKKIMFLRTKTAIKEPYKFAEEIAPRFAELILDGSSQYELNISKLLQEEIKKIIIAKIQKKYSEFI